MRKSFSLLISVAILMAICIPGQALAARYEQNPDHIPSIGISAGSGWLTGTLDVLNSGSTTSQDASEVFYDVTLDFRLPVSERLTLFGAVSGVGKSYEQDETAALTGEKIDLFGGAGRIGLRIYFP